VLDTERRELHRGTELVALEPQVFDLPAAGRQQGWFNRRRLGGRIVSESTLTSHRLLRPSGRLDEPRVTLSIPERGVEHVVDGEIGMT
jgi:hypothetical protein